MYSNVTPYPLTNSKYFLDLIHSGLRRLIVHRTIRGTCAKNPILVVNLKNLVTESYVSGCNYIELSSL